MHPISARAAGVLVLLLGCLSFAWSDAPARRVSGEALIDPILDVATHLLNKHQEARKLQQAVLEGQQLQHGRQLQSLDLKLPTPSSADALISEGGTFIKSHMPSGQRLGDFLAGAAAGMVVVMFSLGIAFGCRQLVCRRRNRGKLPLETAGILIEEQDQQVEWTAEHEAAVPPFTYSEREQEIMDHIKVQAEIEAERKRTPRKWWQRASEPKDIPSASGHGKKTRDPGDGRTAGRLLSNLKWPWLHPGEGNGYKSPGLMVTRLIDSHGDSSPPWKRRSVEVVTETPTSVV